MQVPKCVPFGIDAVGEKNPDIEVEDVIFNDELRSGHNDDEPYIEK